MDECGWEGGGCGPAEKISLKDSPDETELSEPSGVQRGTWMQGEKELPDLPAGTDGLAEREQLLGRRRQAALAKLHDAIRRELAGESSETAKCETLLWNVLILYQDVPFVTTKKLDYTYSIRGYEMFVSRKDKSITRSTVNLAFGTAMELLKADIPISGPKKLKAFGASYLYPIFIQLGVIPLEKTRKRKKR